MLPNEHPSRSIALVPAFRPGDLALLFFLNLAVFLPILWQSESRIWGASDNMSVGYSSLMLAARLIRSGQLPLWNTTAFGGWPLLADPQSFILYPLNWPFFLFPSPLVYDLIRLLHYPICSFLALGFFRSMKLRREACLLGAMALPLSGFFLSHPLHYSTMGSVAWIPAILWAAQELRNQWQARWFVLGAAAVALQILGGHLQFTAYAGVIVLFVTVTGRLLHRQGRGAARHALSIVAMYGAGALLATPQWASTAMILFGSRRTGLSTHELMGSNPWTSWTLSLFPWWRVPLWSSGELPEVTHYGYPGLLAAGLAAFAVLFAGSTCRKRCLPWLLVATFGLTVSLGLFPWFVRAAAALPIFGWFRDLSRHTFDYGLATAVLAAFGLDSLLGRRDDPKVRKRLAFLLGFIVVTTGLFDLFGPEGIRTRKLIVRTWVSQDLPGFLQMVPLWLILLFDASFVFWFLRRPEIPRKKTSIAGGVLLVHVAEMCLFIGYWTHYGMAVDRPLSIHPLLGQEAALEELREHHLRYISVQENFVYPHIGNFGVFAGVDNALGYNPVLSTRFLATLRTTNEMGVLFDPYPLETAPQILDMLAVRYCSVVKLNTKGYFARLRPSWSSRSRQVFDHPDRWELVAETERGRLYRNRFGLPRAWMVKKVRWLPGNALAAQPDLAVVPPKPREMAYAESARISQPTAFEEDFSATGTVNILSRINHQFVYETESTSRAFIVFSESHNPQWRLYIDGEEGDLYRVNGLLMGASVPAGKHRVELRTTAEVFWMGLLITVLTVLALGLAVARQDKAHAPST